jgi:predicted Zn-dependent peptidase
MLRKLKIIISVILATLVSAPMFLKKEKKFIKIVESSSSCGIKVCRIRIKSENVVYVKCKFKNSGVLHNIREKHGISIIIGDIIFRKIGKLSSEETERKIAELGIGDLNVDASGDDFIVSFLVLKNKIEDALKFLSPIFTEPEFSKNDLEFVKSKHPQISDPETSFPTELLSDELMEMLYVSHNYGLNNTGTAQAIGSITENDVRDFIKLNFTKDKLEVFFAGDISHSETESYAEIIFAKLPKNGEGKKSDEDLFSCQLREEKVSIIYKENMGNIIGVATGIRLDNLSNKEKAAARIILKYLFDKKFGDFLSGLRSREITYSIIPVLTERYYSSVFCFSVFIDKGDLERYKKYAAEKFSEYRYKLNLKDLEFLQDCIAAGVQNGFTNLIDIDKQIEENLLPFSEITLKDFMDTAEKIFNESHKRTVFIGTSASLGKTDSSAKN